MIGYGEHSIKKWAWSVDLSRANHDTLVNIRNAYKGKVQPDHFVVENLSQMSHPAWIMAIQATSAL